MKGGRYVDGLQIPSVIIAVMEDVSKGWKTKGFSHVHGKERLKMRLEISGVWVQRGKTQLCFSIDQIGK